MEKKSNWIVNGILCVLSCIWIAPIVFVFMNTLKGKQEYNLGSLWDLPKGNQFVSNFQYIIESKVIFDGMASSFLYAILGAGFALVIAILAAYAISHLQIKHRLFWFLFIYSGTIFPFQIYLIPVYKAYSKIHLYDTRLGMILFYTAICIPFCMFVLRNFFMGIDREICESAKVDGATKLQILTKIFIPMAKAPIAILFMSQFNWSWNELMFGLTFTKTQGIRTVMATISVMDRGNVPVLFLACIIVSLPTIILFVLLQKNFDSGFVYTAK
ncbi:MAG: carbohydrate ABC transporter permease [Hungatella sp.]